MDFSLMSMCWREPNAVELAARALAACCLCSVGPMFGVLAARERRLFAPLVRGSLERAVVFAATIVATLCAFKTLDSPEFIAAIAAVAASFTGELLAGDSRNAALGWFASSVAAQVAISLIPEPFVATVCTAAVASGVYLMTRGDAPGELALSWRADRC